ncbi:MAG: efflux RND transporter periplasmic adaptor subunit [Gammaproteobacteria bacterium]|nr:efflux RND transporter periplasmic adaptor subunit [Gammaproteobacteria bacterium]
MPIQSEQFQQVLALQNNLYDCEEYKAITDFIVNDTFKLIKYQLAVIFSYSQDKNKANIIEISGTIDTKDQRISAEFNAWLHNVLKKISENFLNASILEQFKNNKIILIHPDQLTSEINQGWAEKLGKELLIVKLSENRYLILFNNIIYPEAEIINLNLISKSYQQALKINKKNKKLIITKNSYFHYIKKNILWIILGLIITIMFVRITPSVMAPAQLISEQSLLINAPITGIIKQVYIEPNTQVTKNQILLEYDQLDLNNNFNIKFQELKSLEAEQTQTQALGFEDKEQRGKIFKLQQDIQAKKQEITYAEQQLQISKILSPAVGIVLFKSKDDLIGKPVKAGETMMKLAIPTSQALEIWLNINDNINLNKNMELYYYSNKNPFRAIKAILNYYSYEAYVTPQKKVAYRLIARFPENINNIDQDLVIGDQGQVKIYGQEKISLARYLFQKPLIKLRQWYYKLG